MDDLLLQVEAVLWSRKVESLPVPLRAAVKTLRFLYAIIRDILTTTLTLRAMGLVYITILSIVPMLALIFAGLKGFGFHKKNLEPILLNVFEPLGAQGVELTNRLIGFVDNVQGGLLAGVGLLLLVYTTVSMIRKIEESLNHIWRVDNARSLVQRFGEYLSIIIIGPIVMLTAVTLIAAVGSNALVDRILDNPVLGATAVLIGKLTPYLLVSLVFAFFYWFIPNTTVKFRCAMLGGLIGGVLWATMGVLFATFVVTSTRNVTIYASFAIVIIALMWLYINWLILLTGAQAAFYAQYPEYQRVGYRQLNVANQIREKAALSMMLIVAEAFRNTDKLYTANEIGSMLHVPGIILGGVRKRLVTAGLLEVGSSGQLVPARDPAHIKLLEVIKAMRTAHATDIYQDGKWPPLVDKIAGEVDDSVRQLLADRSLYDLLDEGKKPG